METIVLGAKVTEKVSGFTGIVTGIACYLRSETHYLVTAQNRPDGDVKDYWFSRDQLEVIE